MELIFLAFARLCWNLFNTIYQDERKLREKDGSVKGKDFWQINSASYPTVSTVNSTYIHTYIHTYINFISNSSRDWVTPSIIKFKKCNKIDKVWKYKIVTHAHFISLVLKKKNRKKRKNIFSNLWMRLRRIWRIKQIEEQPRSQGSLLPALRSVGRVGENPGNEVDRGGCYPQRPKDEVDNTLWHLLNSSHPMKAEFINCFIIHSK